MPQPAVQVLLRTGTNGLAVLVGKGSLLHKFSVDISLDSQRRHLKANVIPTTFLNEIVDTLGIHGGLDLVD